MTALVALLALVLAWAIGWLSVRRAWPAELLFGTRLLRACLAFGVGVGTLSLVWFSLLVAVGEASSVVAVGGELTLLALLVMFDRRVRSGAGLEERAATAHPWSASRRVVVATSVLSLVVLAGALVTFGCATLTSPHGMADALAIWNLRAQLLCDSGTAWQRALAEAPSLHHVDYPLLLPLAVARIWQYVGDATPVASAGLAAGFTFALAGMCWGTLRRERGPVPAAAGMAVLLASPAYLAIGAMQYADVPLAFFLTATIVLLGLHTDRVARGAGDRRLVVLAGAAMGLAAWTKNEGMLSVLVVPLAMFVTAGRGARRRIVGDLLALFVGATPALAALLVFKITLVPTNDLVQQVAAGNAWGRLGAPDRWWTIAGGLAMGAWSLGAISVGATVLWLATHRVARWRLPAVIAIVTLLGYAAAYLCASVNVEWHLGTSAQRLLVHLLPMTLLAVFSGRAADRTAPVGVTSPPPSSGSARS